MTDTVSITISPQLVTVEIADPNTLLTAADRVQTGLDRVATASSASTATTQAGIATAQAVISTAQAGIATAQAVIATTKASEAAASAASIRVDSATYAAIPTLTTPCFVFVATDETNDNLPTVYFFDGSDLQWLPSVEV